MFGSSARGLFVCACAVKSDWTPALSVPEFVLRGDRVCDEQDQVDSWNGKRGWWTESDNAVWEQYEEARL